MSFKTSLTLHCLLFYEISITLPFFFCNNEKKLSNFPSNDCYTIEHIIILIINLIIIINKLMQIFLASVLFNDFSFYLCKLPWSSCINYTTLGINILKVYLIIFPAFFPDSGIIKFLLFYIFAFYIVYQRNSAPTLFRKAPTNVKLYFEGFYLSYGVVTSILYYFTLLSRSTYIYVFIISVFSGFFYMFVFKFLDINMIFSKEFKLLDEKSAYVKVLKLKDIIMRSFEDQESFFQLIMFFNKHNEDCKKLFCSCHQIRSILNSNEEVGFEIESNKVINVTKDDLMPKHKHIEQIKDSRMNRMNELHVKVWGKLLLDIIMQNPISDYLNIEIANIKLFFVKNFMNALYHISKINSNEITILSNFLLHITKENMKNFNKDSDETNSMEIESFLEYNKCFETFNNLLLKSTNNCKKFWTEIKRRVFRPEIVEKNGNKITEKTLKIEIIFQKIIKLNPSDYRLYKLYGSYLQSIWRWEDDANNYILRAFNQIKFNKTVENHDRKFKFIENTDSGITIISADDKNTGIIDYCNLTFCNIFNYDKKDLIGKNISKIMPWNIGNYHNNFIINYFQNSNSKIINKLTLLPGLTKQNNLQPIKVFIKMLPFIEKGVFYIGIIKKSDTFTKNSLISLNRNIGFIMTDMKYRIICFDEKIEKKLSLNKNLIFNPLKIENFLNYSIFSIFPELVIKSKLNEMKYSEFILNYNPTSFEENSITRNTNMDSIQNLSIKRINKSPQDNIKFNSFKNANPAIRLKTNLIEHTYNLGKLKFLVFQIELDELFLDSPNKLIEDLKDKLASDKSIQLISSNNMKNSETKNTQKIKSILQNVKKNVYELNSPKKLRILLFIFIFFLFFVCISSIIETVLAFSRFRNIKSLFSLAFYFYQENSFLNAIINRSNSFLLIKSGAVQDFVNFNNTLESEYNVNKIIIDILNINKIQNNVNNLNLPDSLTYVVTNNQIISQNYKDDKDFTVSSNNLPTTLSSILFRFENFYQIYSNLTLLKDDIILNNQIGFYNKTYEEQNFLKEYLSLMNSYYNGLNVYYNFYFDLILNEILNNLTTHSNNELLIFSMGEIVCFCFIILYIINYFIFNKIRFQIFYLLKEISEEDIEKIYNEVDSLKTNFNEILKNDDFFINLNKEIFYDIEKREDKKTLSNDIALSNNDKSNDIQKRVGKSNLENTFTIQKSTSSRNRLVMEKKNSSIQSSNKLSIRLTEVKQDSIGLKVLEQTKQNSLESKFKTFKESENNIKNLEQEQEQAQVLICKNRLSNDEKEQKKLIEKHIRKYYLTLILISSAFLYSIYFIISYIGIRGQTLYIGNLISTLKTFYFLHGNFSSFITNTTYLLINNKFPGSFKFDYVSRNYNYSRLELLELNIFVQSDYSDFLNFYNQYQILNTLDLNNNSLNLCNYFQQVYTNYTLYKVNNSLILTFCENSFFEQGYELGIIKSTDLLLDFFDNLEKVGNLSSLDIRYKILSDISLNRVSLYYQEIYFPLQMNLTSSYYNNVQVLIDQINIVFVIKLCLILIYGLINYVYYFSFTHKMLLEKIVFNKAIILIIPSFAYKKDEQKIFNYLEICE